MSDDVPADFAFDFERLMFDPQPIQMEISKYQAWCLMSAVQLALRHPEALKTAPMKDAERIARVLQEHLSMTPALARVAEAGWTE